jgi:putative membrane protein
MINCLASAIALMPPVALAQPSTPGPYWDWPGPWHMWGWGFWWVFPVLMFVMIGLCVYLMTRMFAGGHGHTHGDTTSSALRLLNERFAKGEVSKEEFEEKRTLLGDKA